MSSRAREQQRGDVLDAAAQLHGDERSVAGGIEDAGLPDHPLCGEARGLPRRVHHRVQRVADHDEHRVRAVPGGLLGHTADDLDVLGQQVVAAHARLAGQTRGDDDDVAAGRVLVAVRADDLAVEPLDRRRLTQIQGLALRHPLDNVHQDDVAQLLGRCPMSTGRPDVPAADDRDLRSPSHILNTPPR
jgi:hypothetical protein